MLAEVDAVGPLGPDPMAVSGAVVSTVQVRVGLAGVHVAGGVGGAHAEGVAAVGEAGEGLGGGAGVPGRPRRACTRSVEPVSLEEKVRLAEPVATSAAGPPPMVVLGATVSTVQVRVASLASTLPAASVARTRKVWLPSASPLSARGEVQLCQAPESSLHSNVAASSSESKPTLAEADATVPLGPDSIVVSGATVSTVQVRVGLAGVHVAGGVRRADAEAVRSLGEGAQRARRRARLPRAASRACTRTWSPSRSTRTRRRRRPMRSGRSARSRSWCRARRCRRSRCAPPRWRRCCRRRRWRGRANVWSPCARPVSARGEVQVCHGAGVELALERGGVVVGVEAEARRGGGRGAAGPGADRGVGRDGVDGPGAGGLGGVDVAGGVGRADAEACALPARAR